MPHLTSKLPQVGITIFSEMSALAQKHQAINLSQGFPDFNADPALLELVEQAMKDGFNQYAPMNGWPPLCECLAQKIYALYSLQVDPTREITITPGGTYALYTAFSTLLNKDDEVIVFEPAYDSYIPAIELQGARAVTIPLEFPTYGVPWNQVEAAITSKTKLILINNPHNPSGYVWTHDDLLELQEIAVRRDLWVISDEVYEHLTFDQRTHQSVLKFPELFNRSLAIFSFGKVFHTTGWKLGYCIGPATIMQEFRKIHQFLAFSCHTPTQVALTYYLQRPESYLQLPDFYQQKRDLFVDLLKQLPFELHEPAQGSYFQLAAYSSFSNLTDHAFAHWLTREYGVATIPVSAFYRNKTDHQVVRFCFAKKTETLEAAFHRLSALNDLKA